MTRQNQINQSKTFIIEALKQLLKTKSFSAITMTDIAKEANIVRMTLYRHFNTKEDIILYIIEEKLHHFSQLLGDPPRVTPYDLLLFRFATLKQSPFTTILYHSNQLDKLFLIIRRHLSEKIRLVQGKQYDPFLQDFFIGGTDRVTQTWIAEGMKTPPEELATQLSNLVNLIQGARPFPR